MRYFIFPPALRVCCLAASLLFGNICASAQSEEYSWEDTTAVSAEGEATVAVESEYEGIEREEDWETMPLPPPTLRAFRSDKLNEYRGEKKYRYEKPLPKEAMKKKDADNASGNSAFDKWLRDFGAWVASKNIGDMIALTIASLAVLLLLGGVFRGKLWSKFSPQSRSLEAAAAEAETVDIRDRVFVDAISAAANSGDFRQAVRLMYLNALKSLAQGSYIHWRINKTNYDYLTELNGSVLKPPFRELTRHYEWAIYGDFRLSETEYHDIRTLFLDFQAAVGAERRVAA